jgi:phosphoglycolate phosphatase
LRPEAIRAVVFDLDGTLVDSRRDLAEAVNRMRGELGLAPLDLAEVVGMVGRGARNLVRSALGGEVDEARVDLALARFLAHYDELATDATMPYPGIPRLLAELAGSRPLALLTNKPERPTLRILEHFDWSRWFRTVVGGDSLPVRKPDPGGLVEIARRLGVAPGELLLVGDSRIDAETAAAAGAPFVFAEWGFASAADREALGAAWRARDAESLRRFLGRAVPAAQ